VRGTHQCFTGLDFEGDHWLLLLLRLHLLTEGEGLDIDQVEQSPMFSRSTQREVSRLMVFSVKATSPPQWRPLTTKDVSLSSGLR